MSDITTSLRRGPKPRPHTRGNLIHAGMTMFHEMGYNAAGIKDIVNLANVPKGSFYNYFESKELFGKAVIDDYFLNSLTFLQQHFENQDLPPLQRLRSYFEQRIENFRATGYMKGCLMGNMSLEVADHSAAIRESLSKNFYTWSRLFETCIAEAQQDGSIQNRLPASQLAHFILNSWEGTLLRMRVEKNDQPLQEFLDVVFKSILI